MDEVKNDTQKRKSDDLDMWSGWEKGGFLKKLLHTNLEVKQQRGRPRTRLCPIIVLNEDLFLSFESNFKQNTGGQDKIN